MTCYPQSNVDAPRAEWRYDITAVGALKSSKWQRLRATPPDAAGAGAGAGCDAAKGDRSLRVSVRVRFAETRGEGQTKDGNARAPGGRVVRDAGLWVLVGNPDVMVSW